MSAQTVQPDTTLSLDEQASRFLAQATFGPSPEAITEHPDIGPFIGRLLIQRLVTSNPLNGYVGHIAAAFADNGHGQRGDMLAGDQRPSCSTRKLVALLF